MGLYLPSDSSPANEITSTSATVGVVGRPAKEIILDQIFHSDRTQNNISMVYRETLKTITKIFNEIFYINSENEVVDIKCMHANPERAIAKLKQETNIILPVLSVAQTTSEDDTARRRTDYTLVHEKWWDKDRQRAYRVISMAPRAVNIEYVIHAWAKYKSDLDQMTEQIRVKFFPSMDVTTTYSNLNQAFLTEESDEGAVDLGDKEDRILRKSFHVQVQTYIPTPKYLVTSTGQIRELNSEFYITDKIV